MPHRFLLDQNFPAPIVDVSQADRSVEYAALWNFDKSLTRRGTPDWVIYLRAREEGFTGVVTRDASQLKDVEELVALDATQLAVVTWDRPIEDPITEWGQLLAYMPIVRRWIDRDGPAVFRLPKPRLDSRNVRRAHALLGEMAQRREVAFPELREQARRAMRTTLEQRSLQRLIPFLDPRTIE